MTKVIYVGGYGHSGSTLLESLMAGSPAILACGEVVSALRERHMNKKNKPCSCGRAAKDCPVWGFLFSSDAGWDHAQLLDALRQRAEGEYAAIVDSSKTAWGQFTMPFRLRRRFGSDFTLVHLVRQPIGSCWSVLRKKAKAKGETPVASLYALRCGWTVFAWSVANMSCELFGRFYPRQYTRLRYEDLVRDPVETLSLLFQRVMPGSSWSFVEASSRDNRHQLQGNSIRHRQLTIEDVKEDVKWKSEMPPQQLRMVQALSFLLRRRYGY